MALLKSTVYDRLQSFIYGDFSVAFEFFIEQFRNAGLKAGDQVVDIGCGTGLLSPRFTASDIGYTGIDIESDRIALAKLRNPNAQFICGDLRRPAVLKKLDLRFCMIHAVIHHLPDTQVAALLTTLSNNGCEVLCTMDPVRPFGWSRPFATLVCNLDDGKYVRSESEYKNLFSGQTIQTYRHKYPRWPADILYIAAKIR